MNVVAAVLAIVLLKPMRLRMARNDAATVRGESAAVRSDAAMAHGEGARPA
jgi:hypothetical protein